MKNRLLFLTLSCSLVACSSSPARLSASNAVPGAEGDVKTSKSDNGNTKVRVNVKHLASPDKIASNATTFVVWASPQKGDAPQNLGALKVDNNLEGTLDTTTPLQSFHLFITPEPAMASQNPSNSEILWTDVVATS